MITRKLAAPAALVLASASPAFAQTVTNASVSADLLDYVSTWGFLAVGIIAAGTGIRIVMKFVRGAK